MREPVLKEALNRSTPELKGALVHLRPKKPEDAVDDYRWRQDNELCRLDATQPLSSSFEEYLQLMTYVPYVVANSYNFSIDTLAGSHIGNCSCFNIDDMKREAEIGIMIGDKSYWDRGYGTDVVRTVLQFLFSQTVTMRVHLKTLDWNTRALQCYLKCGFQRCGILERDGKTFILMEIYRPVIGSQE